MSFFNLSSLFNLSLSNQRHPLRVFHVLLTVLLLLLVSGCNLAGSTKTAAVKGCGIGAVVGAAAGLIKGGISNALMYGAGGCVVGGAANGALAYRQQLKDAKALEAQAKAQGLQPTVVTKDVTPADSKTPEPALERLVLPLNAKDTAAHGTQTAALLTKAARIASADTAGQHITITLAGSNQDRDWMRSVMSPLVGNAATFAEVEATSPRIELSPVPSVTAAPASGFDARTGTWAAGKGGH
jgi:hypothetical protein